MASSTGSLSPPSTANLPSSEDSNTTSNPLAEIPPLSTYTATTDENKIAALKLVADSVAQQRQVASRAVIFNPLTVAVWIALLAIVAQLLYKGSNSDLAIIGTTWAGVVMAGLVSVRWLTSGYIEMAENTGTWKWLDKDREEGNNKEDTIIVSKFGEEIIGALVLRSVKDETPPSGSGKGKKKISGRSMGVIRAWTVRLRFRGKGVGTELLEEAIKVCREKGIEDPVFAKEQANSGRILPKLFNGVFDRREQRAKEALERIIEEAGDGKKKGGRK